MKIAVTGATGFIGRHVVAELDRRSISAILICRPSADVPAAFSKHRIISLDLKRSAAQAFEMMGKPDALIHLAWGGLPNYRSLHHFEEELPAQYAFIKALVDSGLQNILVTGTCFEYGMQSGPLSEDMEARPNNPYGFAKDTLRRQIEYLRATSPFNLTWARLFYVFGDGQAANSLLPQLKRTVELGGRVFHMSGGEQLRDFMAVSEVAKVLIDLALTGRDNGVVNICSGRPVSVRGIVEKWVKEHSWEVELDLGYYPYPDYEPMAFWGDRSKLLTCLAIEHSTNQLRSKQ